MMVVMVVVVVAENIKAQGEDHTTVSPPVSYLQCDVGRRYEPRTLYRP